MLLEFETRSKLVVAATGSGGYDELLAKLQDDIVQFGVFKVVGIDRKGGRTSSRDKCVALPLPPARCGRPSHAPCRAQVHLLRLAAG